MAAVEGVLRPRALDLALGKRFSLREKFWLSISWRSTIGNCLPVNCSLCVHTSWAERPSRRMREFILADRAQKRPIMRIVILAMWPRLPAVRFSKWRTTNQNFPRHKLVTLQHRARSEKDRSSSSEVRNLSTCTLYCRRRREAHWFLYNQGLSVTHEMEVSTSSEFTSSAILPNVNVVLRNLRFTQAKFCSYCISEQHLKGDSVFVFAKKANTSSSWTTDEEN